MVIDNVYEDARRAEAYAKLEFPGTYYLAYRDLPKIIGEHVRGRKAIDFGCGTGRSTRFLRELGFETIGVDIAEDMIKKAREIDPRGDYRLLADGSLSEFEQCTLDLVLSVFTFDNIPSTDQKVKIFREQGRLLQEHGRIVNLVSASEIYTHEWVSFSTRDFPENKEANSGDQVKIIITDTEDPRPVVDVVCSDEEYQTIYTQAGLEQVVMFKPLARDDEPYQWVNETHIAPWVIYVLKKAK